MHLIKLIEGDKIFMYNYWGDPPLHTMTFSIYFFSQTQDDGYNYSFSLGSDSQLVYLGAVVYHLSCTLTDIFQGDVLIISKHPLLQQLVRVLVKVFLHLSSKLIFSLSGYWHKMFILKQLAVVAHIPILILVQY